MKSIEIFFQMHFIHSLASWKSPIKHKTKTISCSFFIFIFFSLKFSPDSHLWHWHAKDFMVRHQQSRILMPWSFPKERLKKKKKKQTIQPPEGIIVSIYSDFFYNQAHCNFTWKFLFQVNSFAMKHRIFGEKLSFWDKDFQVRENPAHLMMTKTHNY